MEYAISIQAIKKSYGLLPDVNNLRQDHDPEAAPKCERLRERRFEPRPQREKSQYHIDKYQPGDNLRIQINTEVHRQQDSAKRGPPGTAFGQAAQQEI